MVQPDKWKAPQIQTTEAHPDRKWPTPRENVAHPYVNLGYPVVNVAYPFVNRKIVEPLEKLGAPSTT